MLYFSTLFFIPLTFTSAVAFDRDRNISETGAGEDRHLELKSMPLELSEQVCGLPSFQMIELIGHGPTRFTESCFEIQFFENA